MPYLQNIENIVPQLGKIAQTRAIFQTTTITYDSTATTYDSATQVYGGDDTVVDLGPQLEKPIDL